MRVAAALREVGGQVQQTDLFCTDLPLFLICSYSWLEIALNAGWSISKCRSLQLGVLSKPPKTGAFEAERRDLRTGKPLCNASC